MIHHSDSRHLILCDMNRQLRCFSFYFFNHLLTIFFKKKVHVLYAHRPVHVTLTNHKYKLLGLKKGHAPPVSSLPGPVRYDLFLFQMRMHGTGQSSLNFLYLFVKFNSSVKYHACANKPSQLKAWFALAVHFLIIAFLVTYNRTAHICSTKSGLDVLLINLRCITGDCLRSESHTVNNLVLWIVLFIKLFTFYI